MLASLSRANALSLDVGAANGTVRGRRSRGIGGGIGVSRCTRGTDSVSIARTANTPS